MGRSGAATVLAVSLQHCTPSPHTRIPHLKSQCSSNYRFFPSLSFYIYILDLVQPPPSLLLLLTLQNPCDKCILLLLSSRSFQQGLLLLMFIARFLLMRIFRPVLYLVFILLPNFSLFTYLSIFLPVFSLFLLLLFQFLLFI